MTEFESNHTCNKNVYIDNYDVKAQNTEHSIQNKNTHIFNITSDIDANLTNETLNLSAINIDKNMNDISDINNISAFSGVTNLVN
jgi:hypothetical protein